MRGTGDKSVDLARLRREVEKAPESARARANLGTGLAQLGLMVEAQKELEKAVELDASLWKAWVNLGGVYLSRWEFSKCVSANAAALAAKPDLFEAHYNKGLGHLYLGEADQVVACFERAVELNPRHGGAHYHLAVGLHAQGDSVRARDELMKALELGFSPQPEFIKAMERVFGGDFSLDGYRGRADEPQA